MQKEIFWGIDVGTNSIGYAVTDTQYNILKYKGEPMWGTSVFEAANTRAERRAFRIARRRLDRRQQRVILTQQIFAKEIAKVDEKFFIRIKESGLYREDTSTESSYFLFEQEDFSDCDYYKQYPTIHHLIQHIMRNTEPMDVRLVYLSVSWFMAHRGHFLNEVDKENISEVLEFERVYDRLKEYCINRYGRTFWDCDVQEFQKIMKQKISVTRKEKIFLELLNHGKKWKASEEDILDLGAVIKLLSGGKVKPTKIFLDLDADEIESVSLGMPEENFAQIVSEIGDDGELLIHLREIYDWALLADILSGEKTISDAKVKIYEQHKKDLNDLKIFVRKYLPEKYGLIFRDCNQNNYAAYSAHNTNKKCDKEVFGEFLKKQLKNVKTEGVDQEFYKDMMDRIEAKVFLPKQVDTDNRVIPYQLYWYELNQILQNAKHYLPFLTETDEEGYSNADKLLSIFEFRIPYFVGPLRTDNSKFGWMKRKDGMSGKIYPWNFDKIVDFDYSEQEFIARMTNQCTYLPGESVLPKSSLLYSKYMVLNEINNIKVNGQPIPVDIKWKIYEKFKERKNITVKIISDLLKSNGCMTDQDILSGLDQKINTSLASYHAFKNLLGKGILTESDVEKIIRYMTYSSDKRRLKAWLEREYPEVSPEDRKYILRIKVNDFGRLSEKFLTGIHGVEKETGEIMAIMDALWNTNDNLMQILSDKYTFAEMVEEEQKDFYAENPETLDGLLDRLYVSNAVKRPIYRTLAVMEDIRKATKTAPKRIFIEMARGGGEKGKRTLSRRDQIKAFYAGFDKQDVRELSKLLDEKTDYELQSEVLFLYFMQMGRCMYSGKAIDIENLKTGKYNVDHIYPQCRVKDDSLNNKVLVLSELNAEKGDKYPLPSEWRRERIGLWQLLKAKGMIAEEKYKRLVRSSSFTDEELQGFINRQLVETRQSTKVLSLILKQMYPESEIVYVKAGLVSDFRKEFELLKSRQVNDLHHGKDAYLNIVCGNVYHCRFTKNFFVNKEYSLKTKTLFTHAVKENGKPIWNGEQDLGRIKKVMSKNNLHYTRFVFERKGGLFDQNPVKAGNGALPRKANLPIEQYGGYNKTTATFFLLVKYREKKKTDVMFMPVDLWAAGQVMKNESAAMKYAHGVIAGILGKEKTDITILGLPMGLRKIKINTVLSLDGYRTAITGKASGGNTVLLVSMESLKVGKNFEVYIKRLERFQEKASERTVAKINADYDKITKESNLELYKCLLEKMLSTKYSLRFNIVGELMRDSKEAFMEMEVETQCELLLNILSVLKTGRPGGCDLRLIGGKEKSAILTMSSKLSNWKKTYRDVRILDVSPSGIYEKASENILEML